MAAEEVYTCLGNSNGRWSDYRNPRAPPRDERPAVRDDWTPLAHAALHDSMECARILLEAGADPEHPGITGRTPLDRTESERMRQLLDHYCK